MFAAKVLFGAVFLVAVTARSVDTDQGYEDEFPYRHVDVEEGPYFVEDVPTYEGVFYHPGYLSSRVRRQAQGSVTFNSDGSTGLAAKVPIARNDKNVLSALGTMDLNNHMKSSSRGLGLALDNVNGHSLTVMKETIPGFGDKLTGAGKLNLFHNDNHNVNANAFVSKNMPNIPQVPNFNTVGGGVDYMNKVGASLDMASTPFLQRKDYSAMGNLNLFRNPTSSVDLSGGFKRFETPVLKSSWEPHWGLSFSRAF